MSVRASSSEPAAEVRLEDRASRSAVSTETLPPDTIVGASPPHMRHGWPVSSGAGPLYGAGGAAGSGDDGSE